MRTDADCSEAERSAKNATDFRALTAALNEQLGVEDKLQVAKAMWAVACTAGQLTAHCNHVLRRDADLLHLPHGACNNAELRARAVAGQAQALGLNAQAGNCSATVEPWPTVLCTATSPRSSSTMRLKMIMPRPLPSSLVAGATLRLPWSA